MYVRVNTHVKILVGFPQKIFTQDLRINKLEPLNDMIIHGDIYIYTTFLK